MPSENRARHLQKCIILCSALGILVVGLVVGATTMMPLYDHLRKVQESHLVLALATKTTAIEEYAARSKDIASRHAAYQQLDDYRNGRISLDQLAEFTRLALFDSVNHFPEVAGVTRFDDKGNPKDKEVRSGFGSSLCLVIADGRLAGSKNSLAPG